MIKVLDKQVADKIAAGEVIERPASIIKELIENSIDAGASSLTVEIKKGGKEWIRVTDNGSGIPQDQLRLAFVRHATSKISQTADLKRLHTLGFRGEALPSIGSVTRLEMISKTKDAKTGVRLFMEGGLVLDEQPVGCPNGTTVLCRDLFYNTPARLKFLKTDAAETSLIIDLCSRTALIDPSMQFRLINNGSTVFASPGNGDLLHAILAVYKDREYQNLAPLSYQDQGIKIYGYVSPPSLSRSNARNQYFYVNHRSVRSKVLERGLQRAYRERLFEGRAPICFLFMDTDPATIDVNIHPSKKEIRFDEEKRIEEIVYRAVTDTLQSLAGLSRVATDRAGRLKEESADFSYEKIQAQEGERAMETGGGKQVKAPQDEQIDIRHFLSSLRALQGEKVQEEKPSYEKRPERVALAPEDEKEPAFTKKSEEEGEKHADQGFAFSALQLGPILFGTYITATDDDNFYLIDQHAAHERIHYEEFLEAYYATDKHAQTIATPFSLDIPPSLMETGEEWLSILRSYGYEPELFGENTYIFRAIPAGSSLSEAEGFVRSFLDAYQEGYQTPYQVDIDRLTMRACKASVKARDILTREEAETLLKRLSRCRHPFSCPHGRPTFIRFSRHDIEAMFKRLG